MTHEVTQTLPSLLPCPWCAAEPIVEHVAIGDCDWRCSCPNWNECEAQPETFGPTRKQAIAAWNTRADPERWLPIESAPKDWQPALVWNHRTPSSSVSEEDVERVARAMFEDSVYSSIRWETATEALKDEFRKPARAAIEALKR